MAGKALDATGFRSITVIGVGLLGGSLGLAVKAVSPGTRLVGLGRRRESLDAALTAGVVDEVTLDPAAAVARADLVVLCTPVGQFERMLRAVAPHLRRGTIVTDVGSTKSAVVRQAQRRLPEGVHFVGSHPMAGGEQQGVAFARADLYAARTCILTPTGRTHLPALRRVERFWQALGMRTVRLSPARHDKALARVSHLPHALAALLVNVQDPAELDLAGPGFVDATRIAGGDPSMWHDIFLSNRQAVLSAVDALERHLQAFRAALDAADGEELVRLLDQARQSRAAMLQRRLRQGLVEG